MAETPPGGPRSFGEALRELRARSGLSLTEAVEQARRRSPEIRLSVSSLSRLERDEGRPAEPALLRALARVYEVPYAELATTYVERVYGLGSMVRSPRPAVLGGRARDGEGPYPSSATLQRVHFDERLEALVRQLNPDGRALLLELTELLAQQPPLRRGS
jgi:transcriptional regulator with XRE-family HTH domain